MPPVSSLAQQWLDRYAQICDLQTSIFELLKDESDEGADRLNELVQKQDSEIRRLPFTDLTATDVSSLQNEIEQLQQNHKLLTEAIATKRQSLLDRSSKSKKTGRSINTYRQTQTY